jgi:isopentenyl diphosphate isomerase/L-lactate dehydrogenase-like FMN-dependent dehydrogenase
MRGIANIGDLRDVARRRLPRLVFDFVDGGAEGEVTLRANRAAFDALVFRQPSAVAPPTRETAVEVLGTRLSMPVLIAPCGAARVVHPEGERALARAAQAAGIAYVFPHVAGWPLQEMPTKANLWYQLYPIGPRPAIEAAIARAADAGCPVLVVTADGGGRGMLERNVRNGLAPLARGLSPESAPYLPQMLVRPRWLTRFLRDQGRLDMPNVFGPGTPPASLRTSMGGAARATGFTWRDFEWIRSAWSGPIVLKGVLSGDDTRRAAAAGAQGVVVSNHGGRQLDGAPATMRVLEEVGKAAGGELEVLLDGGVERGADVVKALALGARAVLIGRGSLWGLAVDGQRGVGQALEILRAGIDRTMGILGCAAIADIARSHVAWPQELGSGIADRVATGVRASP